MQNKFERLLQHRGAIVATVVLAVVLVLAAYNIFSWFFWQRIGKSLDDELGRRLESVAGLIARMVEDDYFSTRLSAEIDEVDRLLLVPTFDDLRRDNQLQAIYLVDLKLRALLSSPAHFAEGETISYIAEDSEHVQKAISGQVNASEVNLIQGNRFKSAYAPFKNETGRVIGLVVVEASANFFSLLQNYQRGLIIGGIVSVVVIILFSFFIVWTMSQFLRLQESVHRNERLAAMGQMAATVAHEIRNPLGIIKSTAEVLRSRYEKTGAHDELFSFIPSEVERLNRLVSDFLAFARDRELDLEDGDLLGTIRRAVADIRQETQAGAVEIVFNPEQAELRLPHNADGIRQVLLNLIHNSIEAMHGEGRVEVNVESGSGRARKFVVVSVLDTGPGFPDDAGKIFEPFFTTKTSGSGLGLAVTQQIIRKHGGRIEAENAASGGAVVRFYLPA